MLEAEQDIVAAAKRGDALSFGKLYDHYVKPIYRFIAVKVSVRQEAEDLTHEVFLAAWQKLPSFTFQGFPFSSWLYRIARNRVIDHYRTKKQHADINEIDEKLLGMIDSHESGVDTALDLRKIYTAMKKLSADQQDVLILRFVDDLSPKEIAEVLDKTEGGVRIIQYRAIEILKKQLTTNN
ncbi:MAG: sigma-70 family RNA polymerase sigma factor [bacterium]|nr:sigma-70 family RNA polymerase sigma factor [bacterium]